MIEKKSKRKIPMKNFNSELSCIFKAKLDQKGYSTWKEFVDDIGCENPRTFIDFFNGKQCISKEVMERAFEKLGIDKELIKFFTVEVIKYKIK